MAMDSTSSGPSGSAAQLTEARKDSAPDLALNEGINAVRSGDYARAQKLLEPIAKDGPTTFRATAQLWLARAAKAQGDCKRALSFYDPLLAQKSASNAVLSEAAECYERIGATQQAAALRSRSSVASEPTAPTSAPAEAPAAAPALRE
jgi:uncharacterized protein HemY